MRNNIIFKIITIECIRDVRVMTVYVELVLIENFIVDYFILLMCSKLTLIQAKHPFLASGFGGVYACVMPLWQPFQNPVLKIAVLLAMLGICFQQKRLKQVLPLSFAAFVITCALYGTVKSVIAFKQDLFIYFGYLTVLVLGVYLFKTRPGLNMRAVGQNPAAADAASINVTFYKYAHVLLGGALCGLGGAYLSLVYVPSWQENITAGLGWIAVALIIFATWNPYKAVFGSYLFGGLTILGFRLQGAGMHINQYLVDMTPYIVTILVLVLVSQGHNPKNAPPKALGEPYFREER